MIAPETLPRHELAGLHARVAAASNPALVGIEGRVVDETTRTLVIETDDADASGVADDAGATGGEDGGASRAKQVPKDAATFEFRLPDCSDAEYVTVEGGVLVERPARRTERSGDSTWR